MGCCIAMKPGIPSDPQTKTNSLSVIWGQSLMTFANRDKKYEPVICI